MTLPRNEEHQLQIKPTFKEASRQRFVLALKQDIGRRLRPQLKQFVPSDLIESDDPELIDDFFQKLIPRKIWGRLARSAQEMMWEAVTDPLVREEERLISFYNGCINQSDSGGSIKLDEELSFPEGISDVNVHLQPGGYFLNRHQSDVLAGALYEAGGTIYSQGQSIKANESKAELAIRFLLDKMPDFKPQKILDIACSAGASSTPYARLFPDATVYAIDIAPGLLRYAHARAEALGVNVHFYQCDTESIEFKDASFDLVVSHNAMHEMSPLTIEKMMLESYRLLNAEGIALHQDVPLRNSQLDAYQQADYLWDYKYNNEPFWETYTNLDILSLMKKSGFADARYDRVKQLGGSMDWDLYWSLR